MVVLACDLEVDVNGEETFFVDKKILSSFSGRLNKLFGKASAMAATKKLKVVLHDLPGGPEALELMTRFCYNDGKIQLTPTNTCLLHCAAHFMEMAGADPSSPGLIEETKKSLDEISYWTRPEILVALKQCQGFLLIASSTGVLDKLLETLVGRIATPTDTSPWSSSPESSGIRLSYDTRSTMSAKNGRHGTWWFEDLTCFGLLTVEKAVRIMISRKLDHATISRFLFHYLKVGLANASHEEKRVAIETAVDLLCSLHCSSVSSRGLFWLLRVSSSQNTSRCCRNKLEKMIGVRIDQVTLDNLLVQAQSGTESLYDVDLVLRFLRSFLSSGGREETPRLKRVGGLIDLYLAEVAPDSGLKPAEFILLATALPDAARDSHDAMYRAIDMYLEVHARMTEEEKMRICCAINYKKLSKECCKHLAQNTKFPLRSTGAQALLSQQLKLKSRRSDTDNSKSCGKVVDLSVENARLRANLQSMQWRVMQLEKVCRKTQSQMARINKMASHGGGSRSLPKLCS